MSAKSAKGENIVVPKKWWESLPRKVYSTLEKVETSQPWFEVYRLNAQSYAIYEPYQFEETLSYLVEGKKKAILIDTEMGSLTLRNVSRNLRSYL